MSILSEYPNEVIERVTDPNLGIQRELKFLPTLAEVSDGCKNRKHVIEAERTAQANGWNWNGERWVNVA